MKLFTFFCHSYSLLWCWWILTHFKGESSIYSAVLTMFKLKLECMQSVQAAIYQSARIQFGHTQSNSKLRQGIFRDEGRVLWQNEDGDKTPYKAWWIWEEGGSLLQSVSVLTIHHEPAQISEYCHHLNSSLCIFKKAIIDRHDFWWVGTKNMRTANENHVYAQRMLVSVPVCQSFIMWHQE